MATLPKSEAEYLALAEVFFAQAIAPPVEECSRKHGDAVRFNKATEVFGVLGVGGFIRTFFLPIPCATLPQHERSGAKALTKCHSFATNALYYQAACGQ